MPDGFRFRLKHGVCLAHNEVLTLMAADKDRNLFYLQRKEMFDPVEGQWGDILEATDEGLDDLDRSRFSLLKEVMYSFCFAIEGTPHLRRQHSRSIFLLRYDGIRERFLPVFPLESTKYLDEDEIADLGGMFESASKYVPEVPSEEPQRRRHPSSLAVRFDERTEEKDDEEKEEEDYRSLLQTSLKKAAVIDYNAGIVRAWNRQKRDRVLYAEDERLRNEQLSFKPNPYFDRFDPWWNPGPNVGTGIFVTLKARANVECTSYDLFSEGKISGGTEADGVLRMIKPALPAGPVLFEHQHASLAWLAWKTRPSSFCRGGMICDESGLGKTNICLAFLMMRLNKLKSEGSKGPADPFADDEVQREIRAIEDASAAQEDRKPKRFLIAVPAQLVSEWRRQTQRQLEAAGYAPGQFRVLEIGDHTLTIPLDDAGLEVDVHLVTYTRLGMMQGALFDTLRDQARGSTQERPSKEEIPRLVKRARSADEVEVCIHVLVELARRRKRFATVHDAYGREDDPNPADRRKKEEPPAKKRKVRPSERSSELYEAYPELGDEGLEEYRRRLRAIRRARSEGSEHHLVELTEEWYDRADIILWLDDLYLSKLASSMRFFAGSYDTMICDETSKLTRIEAKCTNAVLRIDAARKILVSASPILRDRGDKGAVDMYAPLCILGSPDVWHVNMLQGTCTEEELRRECQTPLGSVRRSPRATESKLKLVKADFLREIALKGSSDAIANFECLASTYVYRNRKRDIEFADPANETSATRHLPAAMPKDVIYRDLIPFDTPEERELYDYMKKIYWVDNNSRMGTRMVASVRAALSTACNDFFLLPYLEKQRLLSYIRMVLEQKHGIGDKDKDPHAVPSLEDLGSRTVDYLVACYEILRAERETECCVCYEPMILIENAKEGEFAEDAAVVFECAHSTCMACVTRMFAEGRSSVTCPLCRKVIKSLEGVANLTRSVSREAAARRDPAWVPKKADREKGEANEAVEAKMAAYEDLLMNPGRPSTKTRFLRDALYDVGVHHPGDKVVFICQMEAYSARLKECLTSTPLVKEGSDVAIAVRAFHPKVAGRKMVECIEKFRDAPDQEGVVHVLFMTYLSGSLGHNLQFANHLFLVHPFENNAMEFQARHRIVRLGQTKVAHTHRVAVAKSIEEDLIRLNESYDRESARVGVEKGGLAYKLVSMTNDDKQ